jgi:homoserine dehydrogenase
VITPLKLAIAGLGTVGAGTISVLREHPDLLASRCGRSLEVIAVSARDQSKERGIALDGIKWFDDAEEMAREADADVIVELIGGSDGIAKDVCKAAIAGNKHVVTANKALVALHGTELATQAEKAGVALAYEAAVAGGIPIIKSLREGLAGNTVKRVYGILNGTCNYILTEMRENGGEFTEVLKDAQELGYAEADPSFDVDGVDAAHKLAILASVAFGCKVNFRAVHIEGIRHISPVDIEFAGELGYRIKLLGIAAQTETGIEQRVHPCMVPLNSPIAGVEGVFNAIVADTNFADTIMHEGRGAGPGPTASAVVADIIDIAANRFSPTFGIPAKNLNELKVSPMENHIGAFYIRLMVVDKPGVFADVAAILSANKVSMESVLQRGRAPSEPVSVVMTLHETREAGMVKAIDAISKLDGVVEIPRMIRIESF